MKELSTHALCAKTIRTELKKAFPLIKFSVKSSSFSGGDDVNIKYQNGVCTKKVYDVVNKYKDGDFDGMTDMYNYNKNINNLPRVKYLFVDREVSKDIKDKMTVEVANSYGIVNIDDDNEWREKTGDWRNYTVYKEYVDKDF